MDMLKIRKFFLAFLLLTSAIGILSSATTDEACQLKCSVCKIVTMVKMALGAIFLLLIVLAAAVYAIGQVMGAETRARASVWATSMFVGAIIGGLLWVLAPTIINALIGGSNGITVNSNMCDAFQNIEDCSGVTAAQCSS